MHAQCEVCGETKLERWSYCPACGHPYPDDGTDEDDDGWEDEEEDDDDEDGGDDH